MVYCPRRAVLLSTLIVDSRPQAVGLHVRVRAIRVDAAWGGTPCAGGHSACVRGQVRVRGGAVCTAPCNSAAHTRNPAPSPDHCLLLPTTLLLLYAVLLLMLLLPLHTPQTRSAIVEAGGAGVPQASEEAGA